jgi:hypothetical protein
MEPEGSLPCSQEPATSPVMSQISNLYKTFTENIQSDNAISFLFKPSWIWT